MNTSRRLLHRLVSWCATPLGVLVVSLPLTMVLAFLANLALDLVDGGTRLHTVAGELPLFLLGSSVVWLFLVLVVCLVGRLWLGAGIVGIVVGFLAFANLRKQQLVMEPLFPADLAFVANPGFLAQMVGPWVVLGLVGATVAVLLAFWGLGRLAGRWFPRPTGGRHTWAFAGLRVVGVVVSAALIVQVGGFHSPGSWIRSQYEEHGAHWRPLRQPLNYGDNGFVAGMLYNLPMPAMARPDGYGPARMAALAERYSAAADRINRQRQSGALDDVNVVFVLSEAFSDPTRVRGVRLARDPIPFTRSLMKRTVSGSMWAPEYGRGTANSEFEALTGFAIARFRPQVSTPYQMVLPQHDTFPSAANLLGPEEHDTLALHSYTSDLYRREEAYPVLGFDEAVFQDEMTHTRTIEDNPFISDAATFDELTARIDASEAPLVANVVTMQNHYPMAGKYAHPIPSSGLADPAATEQLEHYARGLRHSDRALRDLIAELEASEEKTVMVFYGDHLPILWPPTRLSERTQHETPFFVYANFGHARAKRLPTTSPVHLMNHVLDRADAPVTPFHALLRQLERELPTQAREMLIGPDDRRLAPEDLSGRTRRLLHDYRLVQYDVTSGRRYAADTLFTVGDTSSETLQAAGERRSSLPGSQTPAP